MTVTVITSPILAAALGMLTDVIAGGGESSFCMVPVPVCVFSVAFDGEDKFTVKVSAGSKSVSPFTVTETVL